MNFTFLSLISSAMLTNSPAFVGDHYSLVHCHFQKFFPLIFYNNRYGLNVKDTTFSKGINGIVIIDGKIIDGQHYTYSEIFQSESATFDSGNHQDVKDIKNISITFNGCLFLQVGKFENCNPFRINKVDFSVYVTRTTFAYCRSTSGVMVLDQCRCVTITHVCSFNSAGFGEKSFIYANCHKTDFFIFLFSTIVTDDKLEGNGFANVYCQFGDQYVRCLNMTNFKISGNAFQFVNSQCFSFGMTNIMNCKSRAFEIAGNSADNSYSMEKVNILTDTSNQLFRIQSERTITCTVYDSVLINKGGAMFNKDGNVFLTINGCFYHVTSTENTNIIDSTSIVYDTSYIRAYQMFINDTYCQGKQYVSDDELIKGCNAGDCVNKYDKCERTIGFPDGVVPYPTFIDTQLQTGFFTPSSTFKPTDIFTPSNKFTSSSSFSPSRKFTPSSTFTPSKQFTDSKSFTSSNKFSYSQDFTLSTMFSKSGMFTESTQFSSSFYFTNSGKFSETDYFSETTRFTNSGLFTKSVDFSNSDPFTNSADFNSTGTFTLSKNFTKSNVFSETSDFTYSSFFTVSDNFTYSSFFSKSSFFSFSTVFTETTSFTDSTKFTLSSLFSKSNEFSNSHTFTPSNDFDASATFTPSKCFTQSSYFSSSFHFTYSKYFSESNKFSYSTAFTKSFDFTNTGKFTKSSDFTRSSGFTKSNNFGATNTFTATDTYTPSYYFTKSDIFTKSSIFTESDKFGATKPFTPSNCFSETADFSPSITFKNKVEIIIAIESKGKNKSAIIGGAVAALVAAVGIIIAIAAFFILRNRKYEQNSDMFEELNPIDDPSSSITISNVLHGFATEDDPFEDDFE